MAEIFKVDNDLAAVEGKSSMKLKYCVLTGCLIIPCQRKLRGGYRKTPFHLSICQSICKSIHPFQLHVLTGQTDCVETDCLNKNELTAVSCEERPG